MRGMTFYVPEDVATTPAEGHCFVNRWWMVHPEKGVAFYCDTRRSVWLEPGEKEEPSPQCNSCEITARHLAKKLHPDCEVKKLHAVYLRPAIVEMHKQRKAALPSTMCGPEAEGRK